MNLMYGIFLPIVMWAVLIFWINDFVVIQVWLPAVSYCWTDASFIVLCLGFLFLFFVVVLLLLLVCLLLFFFGGISLLLFFFRLFFVFFFRFFCFVVFFRTFFLCTLIALSPGIFPIQIDNFFSLSSSYLCFTCVS